MAMRIGATQALELLVRYGSPLFVYDVDAVRAAFLRSREAFPYRPLDLHYAIVCNKNPYLVRFDFLLRRGIALNLDSLDQLADLGAARARLSIACGLACGLRLAVDEAPPGDVLALQDVGAYGYAVSSHFLNRPRPAEVVRDGARTFLTTRRETLDDLLATVVV